VLIKSLFYRSLSVFLGIGVLLNAPSAEAQGLEPQIDVVIELMLDGDFEEAGQALRDLESVALGYAQPISSSLVADFAYLDGVLAFYLDQDSGTAEEKWRWCLEADPDYQWRSDLAGGAGEQLFTQLQGDGTRSSRVPVIPIGYEISRSIWIDGGRITERSTASVGWHMIQATCRDGNMRGLYNWMSPDEALPCPCGAGGCFEEIPQPSTAQEQLSVELGIAGFIAGDRLLTRQSLGGNFHTASNYVMGLSLGALWLDPAILDVAVDLEMRLGLYKDVWRVRMSGGAVSNAQFDIDGVGYVGSKYLLGLFGEVRSAPYDDASLGARVGVYPLEFTGGSKFGTTVTALTFFANYDM